MSTRKEIDRAFASIDKVLQPLTKGNGGDHRGEGGDKKVIAARVAVQSLYLLRQWARLGSAIESNTKTKTAKAKRRGS